MKKTILIMASLISLLLLISSAMASAKTYHITLLTVGEVGEETVGGTADAYLEVKPGTGRIFLDSFPLTKLDTQISTRYANRVACDYLDEECDDRDFFYTIRAGSTIVGGPSASAALTVLTIAALKGVEPRNDTVMTGTINSGGSIGPVGGVYNKALAAEKANFTKMLIPLFSIDAHSQNSTGQSLNESRTNSNITIQWINITRIGKSNQTIDERIIIYDKPLVDESSNQSDIWANLTIEVIKVRNIDEALPYFLNVELAEISKEISIPESYTSTMKRIAESLCTHASNIKEGISLAEEEKNQSDALEGKITVGMAEENYYATASYCFNLGVLFRKNRFRMLEEKDPEYLQRILNAAREAEGQFSRRLEDVNITSMTGLESYIIVKERLLEAEQGFADMRTNMSSDDLAYFVERYYSAVYWSEFFRLGGMQVLLDEEYLEDACYKKLSEAEERMNYAELYLPGFARSSAADIKEAYLFANAGNFKMCLFKASFAKAEANLLLTSVSVSEGQLEALVDEKIDAAKRLIAKEEQGGFFPIMGYSYYEYADSLNRNNQTATALVFAEYALELSDMEMYFPRNKTWLGQLEQIDYTMMFKALVVFISGCTIGGLSVALVMRRKKRGDMDGAKRRKWEKRKRNP